MPRKPREIAQNAGISPEIDHEPCRSRIAALEADLKALKRRLAAQAASDPLAASGQPVKRTGSGALDHLADQDRRYMERKLGIKRS